MSGCHPSEPEEVSGKFLEYFVKKIEELRQRIYKLEEHKNLQVDENRLAYRRIEDIAEFCNRNWKHNRQPHTCPNCKGEGLNKNRLVMDGVKEPSTINMVNPKCNSCEGKGIVWG